MCNLIFKPTEKIFADAQIDSHYIFIKYILRENDYFVMCESTIYW